MVALIRGSVSIHRYYWVEHHSCFHCLVWLGWRFIVCHFYVIRAYREASFFYIFLFDFLPSQSLTLYFFCGLWNSRMHTERSSITNHCGFLCYDLHFGSCYPHLLQHMRGSSSGSFWLGFTFGISVSSGFWRSLFCLVNSAWDRLG